MPVLHAYVSTLGLTKKNGALSSGLELDWPPPYTPGAEERVELSSQHNPTSPENKTQLPGHLQRRVAPKPLRLPLTIFPTCSVSLVPTSSSSLPYTCSRRSRPQTNDRPRDGREERTERGSMGISTDIHRGVQATEAHTQV